MLLTGNVLSGDHIEQAGPGAGDGGLATSSSRQLSLQWVGLKYNRTLTEGEGTKSWIL